MALEIKEYVGAGNIKTVNEVATTAKKKKAVKATAKKATKKAGK